MGRLQNVRQSSRKPIRALIYGTEGVGKTKFGVDSPRPIFLSLEGGTDHFPGTHELPDIRTWKDVMDAVRELITEPHDYKTLVIDSADYLERLAHDEVTGGNGNGRSIITVAGGWGAGYSMSANLHRKLLDQLMILRAVKNMNIIVIAHAHVKTVKDAEAIADYDGFAIKCHHQVAALWMEWVDCVLFARFEALVKLDEDREKARAFGSGKRVMFTEERPSFQAKTRYPLPFELPVSWSAFEAALNKNFDSLESVRGELSELIAKVPEEKIEAVAKAIDESASDLERLVRIRNQVRKLVEA